MAEEFRPDAIESALSEDGKRVKLTFSRDAGESLEVVLPQFELPLLIAQLQSKISPGQAVPIDVQSLRPGAQFVCRGFRAIADPATDGVSLIFLASLPDQRDRGVTIPLQLGPSEARDLIGMISSKLDRQP